MTELELKAKLYQKLLKVKEQVTYLKKDTKGFNFEYASPELVLGTLNPLLNEAGLFLKTEVICAEHERVFSKYKVQDIWVNKQKTEKEVEVHETLFHLTMKYTWIDTETGYEDSAQFTASGINNDEQGQGSAQTYGERYFLLKTFNIATGKDDPDALGTKRLGGTATQAAKPTPAAPKADESTPATPKAESPAKDTKKASTKKAETPKLDPKASALDEKGNIKANDAFVEELMDERQAKALAFFKEFDGVNWVKVKAFSKISLKDDPEAAKVAFGCADAKELITKVSVDNCLLIARALTEAAKKGKEEK